MTNDEGLRESRKECLFMVMAKEIPRIKGAIDGLQGGVNEARNRAIEAKVVVETFQSKLKKTLELASHIKLLESKDEQRF